MGLNIMAWIIAAVFVAAGVWAFMLENAPEKKNKSGKKKDKGE